MLGALLEARLIEARQKNTPRESAMCQREAKLASLAHLRHTVSSPLFFQNTAVLRRVQQPQQACGLIIGPAKFTLVCERTTVYNRYLSEGNISLDFVRSSRLHSWLCGRRAAGSFPDVSHLPNVAGRLAAQFAGRLRPSTE
jgi:hypothetical protein